MNPRNVCGWFSCECEEKNRLDKMTLRELENEIYEITMKQNQVTHWGLSDEVESLVIKELQEQKKDMIDAMHKKVDSL